MTIRDAIELAIRSMLRSGNTGEDKLSASQVKELAREKLTLLTEIDERAKSDKTFSVTEVKKAVKGTHHA